MSANCKIKFASNNFFGVGTTMQTSTFQTAFPLANAYDKRRGLVAKFRGNFLITSENNLLYINDGSDKTVSIAVGEYTAAALATEIQTKLNAASSNWEFSHLAQYRFRLIRTSGGYTVRLSEQSNAVWDTIGYTGIVDTVNVNLNADELRIHGEEFIFLDLKYHHTINCVAIFAPINETLKLSPSATVKIQGNNINDWTSPTTSVDLKISESGAFAFPDESHRYWRLSIKDRENTGGTDALSIGYLSISSSVDLVNSSIAQGFNYNYVDNSIEMSSDFGSKYYDLRQKYFELSGQVQASFGNERRELEQFFYSTGRSDIFVISIDPQLKIFAEHGEVTKLVRFSEMPSLQNIVRDYFNVSFSVVEVV